MLSDSSSMLTHPTMQSGCSLSIAVATSLPHPRVFQSSWCCSYPNSALSTRTFQSGWPYDRSCWCWGIAFGISWENPWPWCPIWSWVVFEGRVWCRWLPRQRLRFLLPRPWLLEHRSSAERWAEMLAGKNQIERQPPLTTWTYHLGGFEWRG